MSEEGMTMVDGAHVRPEPIEAPAPRTVLVRDLVRSRALQHGYNAVCAARPPFVLPYAAFVAGVEAYEQKLLDQRRRS